MSAYGSGHFGSWITDDAGLPAYEYTCNHLLDPAAEYATRRGTSRDHFHLLGNAHISAVAHNEGYVELFRPDTGGLWLNRYAPQQGAYAGGFGFLRLDRNIRSTLYHHLGDALYRRIWGVGYFRKGAVWGKLAIDQWTFAPYGDDPVLVSLTTLTNRGRRPLSLTYVEYWDLLLAPVLPGRSEAARLAAGLRVRRSTRFDRARRLLLACPVGTFPGSGAPPGRDDPDPPTIFLAAIDGEPVAGFETSRAAFFGEGGLDAPAGLRQPRLGGHVFAEGVRADGLILALQREVTLAPRSRVVLAHLYGYASWDAGRSEALGSNTPAGLVERYAARPPERWLDDSLQSWRQSLIRFETPGEGWLAREVAWNSYYGQALASFDACAGEAFLDRGGCHTYDWGAGLSPRDTCQQALALLPNNPIQVRGTVRRLTQACRPDGSLIHGCPGYGRYDLPLRQPSDLQLWLLWLIADYALFYRDRAFIDQEVPLYPRQNCQTTTIRQQVRRGLDYLRHTVGRGPHGLLRLLSSDGNNSVVLARGLLGYRTLRRYAESTLNSGLAGVVLPRIAELCRWLGETAWASEAEQWAAENREALAQTWNGRWFDRLLLPKGTPIGRQELFLDCQPWIVLAGAASPEQRGILCQEIRERLVDRSPIGPPMLDPVFPAMGLQPGQGTNGGVSFAVNSALVWALAQDDPAAAWEMLKRCTLARHAEVYPKQWAGIWSGPDGFGSVQATRPGEPWEERQPLLLGGRIWSHRDFPIASGHSANQLLFALARLSGLQADARGYRLQPRLPLPRFAFAAARLGVRWEENRVAGYLVPQGNDAVDIRIDYPCPLAGQPAAVVDGRPAAARLSDDRRQVSFQAFVRGGMRTEWEVTTQDVMRDSTPYSH